MLRQKEYGHLKGFRPFWRRYHDILTAVEVDCLRGADGLTGEHVVLAVNYSGDVNYSRKLPTHATVAAKKNSGKTG